MGNRGCNKILVTRRGGGKVSLNVLDIMRNSYNYNSTMT